MPMGVLTALCCTLLFICCLSAKGEALANLLRDDCIACNEIKYPEPKTLRIGGNGNIFREYIGAVFNGVSFSDVPINPNVDFHFLLAFAIDYTPDGSDPTNGNFNLFWDTNLTPSGVKAIKDQHSNVKVMVSLGGDTAFSNFAQFNPTSVSSWVSNAVSTLTKIIEQYELDGIDIDYEHFDFSNPDEFASCIGQLITKLKKNDVISVASIAPWSDVDEYYQALWAAYSGVIDIVNYQFFTTDPGISASDYVDLYNNVLSLYEGGTIMASFCTEPNVGVDPETALAAAKKLKSSNKLPGMYIFSADDSFTSSNGFDFEQQAQALVAQ